LKLQKSTDSIKVIQQYQEMIKSETKNYAQIIKGYHFDFNMYKFREVLNKNLKIDNINEIEILEELKSMYLCNEVPRCLYKILTVFFNKLGEKVI